MLLLCLLGAAALGAEAQFLVASPDPALALQPPPLQQATFTTFAAQPAIQTQAFIPAPQPQSLPLPLMRQSLAHHAVSRNSDEEARLPEELRNNFYKNPRIAEGLAKESWFIPGEEQVIEREAEKIPRERIFKLLKNAGLARR